MQGSRIVRYWRVQAPRVSWGMPSLQADNPSATCVPCIEVGPKRQMCTEVWPTLRQDPSATWEQGVCPAPMQQSKRHGSPRSFLR